MEEAVEEILTPKSKLLGITLPSGWELVERLEKTTGSSGGNFGVGYKAVRGEESAFVKAIDFVAALEADDPLAELTLLSGLANFERDVLAYCSERRMSRVLRYIGHEYVFVGEKTNPLNRVSCLIMEAGSQDLRRLVHSTGISTCAWNLQVLSDVSEAIAQLHRGGIAHQDLKPSNVIAMPARSVDVNGKKNLVKVGDLGRVVRRTQAGPYDGQDWPGDPRYSPPERWYNHIPSDWNDARDSSDAYMLGSLLVYLFTGTTLQSLVIRKIPEAFWPNNWTGGFDADLLPVLIDAHAQTLAKDLFPVLDPQFADSIIAITRELTHVNPSLRGDSRARRQIGRPVGIDRIHQKLRALAISCLTAELGRSRK